MLTPQASCTARWWFLGQRAVALFGVTSIVPHCISQHVLRQVLLETCDRIRAPEGVQMILSSPVLCINTPRDF